MNEYAKFAKTQKTKHPFFAILLEVGDPNRHAVNGFRGPKSKGKTPKKELADGSMIKMMRSLHVFHSPY